MRGQVYRRVQLKKFKSEVICEGRSLYLVYRLFRERLPMAFGSIYSIAVTQTDRGTGEETSTYVRDVSRSIDEALFVFSAVSEGLVTPDSACEIIGDLISIV